MAGNNSVYCKMVIIYYVSDFLHIYYYYLLIFLMYYFLFIVSIYIICKLFTIKSYVFYTNLCL